MSILYFSSNKSDYEYLYAKGYLGHEVVKGLNCWYYNLYDSYNIKRTEDLSRLNSLKEVESDLRIDTDLWKCYLKLKERFGLCWISDGFSYGFHFAVYTKEPATNHSEYLVYMLREPDISPSDLITLGRSAHSVKKKIILTTPHSYNLKILKFEHVKEDQ